MENKILEFVKEFNAGLENNNEHNFLEYIDNGFTTAVILPQICLYTDDSSYDDVRPISLSSLVRQLSKLQEIATPMLADEVDLFFAEKKKQMKEKFTYAKLKYTREAICRYKLTISGKYNEDIMADFVDVIKEDFEYIFDGFKLDYEY